jgi:hypothetical protein
MKSLTFDRNSLDQSSVPTTPRSLLERCIRTRAQSQHDRFFSSSCEELLLLWYVRVQHNNTPILGDNAQHL